jgi:hypothetical protein
MGKMHQREEEEAEASRIWARVIVPIAGHFEKKGTESFEEREEIN